jgi:hypothetical protein
MPKKTAVKKKKGFETYLAAIAIVCILALVVVFQNKAGMNYRMELYIKTPSESVIKVHECQSSSHDFDCVYNFKDCSENGQYYGRALTITGNSILSDSGWQPTYEC